jgi:hypothetical protein
MFKRLIALTLALLVSTPAFGQVTINNLPSGTSPTGAEFIAAWQNGHTVKLTTSQVGIGGAAGGDLSGSYPNPSVIKINGQTPAAIALSGNAGDLISGTVASARLPLGTYADPGAVRADGVTLAVNAGVLTVIGGGGGGGSPPGGSSGQAQYNAAGVFGGISGLTTDGVSAILAPGNLQLTGASSGFSLLNGAPSGGGTITLPGGTDTLAGVSLGQTFTNKTISGANNSITSIGNASLVNSSITVAGHSIALGGSTTLASSDLVDASSIVTLTAAQTLTNKTLTAPTMTAPILGTIASGNLAAGTGYTAANLAGMGTGMAAFLATPSSANFAAAVTDETGTGLVVLATSPALLGSPTAPTQTASDNSTKIATTAFVVNQGFALAGTGSVITGNVTVTAAQFNNTVHLFTINGSGIVITMPASSTLTANGGGIFINNPTGNTVTLRPNAADKINGGTTGADATLAANSFTVVTTDGVTNLYTAIPTGGGGGGTPGGSTTQLQYNNAGSFGGISSAVFSGGVLTLTSPAFVTPALGTPASGVMTNLTGTPSAIGLANGTGLPLAGLSGLGTGGATFLGTPSSANLRAFLTDEVGTGAAYFVGGALGTPASGTATNLTGLPLTTGVTGTLPIANGGTNCTAGAVSCLTAVGGLTGTASAFTNLAGDGSWKTPGYTNWQANNWYVAQKGTAGAGVAIGSATTYYVPRYIDRALTIGAVGARMSTTATGNMEWAIYLAGSNGLPSGAPVCTTSAQSTGSSGSYSQACSAAITSPGFIWFGMQMDNATSSVISYAQQFANTEIGATSQTLLSGNGTNVYTAYSTTGTTFGTWATNPTIAQVATTTNVVPVIEFSVASIP